MFTSAPRWNRSSRIFTRGLERRWSTSRTIRPKRCDVSRTLVGKAQACLHAGDLKIAERPDSGLRVRVDRTVYQGGYFRLETRPEAAPDAMLHLSVPEPFDAAPGAVIGIDIRGGWIIPSLTPP